ncbi:MAG: phosphatidylglycerophosphatase A [Deltaproteobacteria bacterium]|nr:phosphatidylglycerophosphatase A [Deltaproteobacteria bacterium]
MKFSEDNIRHISETIATMFGVGYVAFAPGTIGTLFGVLIYLLIKDVSIAVYIIIFIIIFIIGIISSGNVEETFGEKDPSFVVIDEAAAFLVVMFLVPYSFLALLLGFVIFRALDITKPPPINYLERVEGGFGIMIDDIVCGLITNIFLQILFG